MAPAEASAQTANEPIASSTDVTFSPPDPANPVSISADHASNWRQGQYEVWHLEGNVHIRQATLHLRCGEAILWVQEESGSSSSGTNSSSANGQLDAEAAEPGPRRVLVYAEGQVDITRGVGASAARLHDQKWYGRLFSYLDVRVNAIPSGKPSSVPAIIGRAESVQSLLAGGQTSHARFASLTGTSGGPPSPRSATPAPEPILVSPQTGMIHPSSNTVAQDSAAQDSAPGAAMPPVAPFVGGAFPTQGQPIPLTNVQFDPRTGASNLNLRTMPGQNANEQVFIGTGGVRVTVDSQLLNESPFLTGEANRRAVLLADSFVAWRDQSSGRDRWEIYLEGDIIFTLGQRTIYARRMYYDPNFARGTILDTEMLTPVPGYEGLGRLKADVIRQDNENRLRAYGAALTTSRLGVPRYWLQSGNLAIHRQSDAGAAVVDPVSGQMRRDDRWLVDSGQNAVYVGGVPLFGWPRIQTDLAAPSYYLRSLKIGNDDVFGFQLQTGWDMYQLFGLTRRPPGADWIGRLDYLSERGIGLGTDHRYRGNSLFGLNGPVNSDLRSYLIKDDGTDNLGLDRRDVIPEKDFRGRLTWQLAQRLQSGWNLKAEVGWISDRNFLEQYYEGDWDQHKDYATGLWLERNWHHHSLNLTADVRVNDFFTETENLPKLDHYTLGQSLLFDRLVYFGHSQIGYRRFEVAAPPTNAVDLAKFDPLAWEVADANGVVAATRHEFDAPFQLGALKVVPYILGEAAYWQEDLTGNDLGRLFGQVGVRTQLPMWRVDPTINSELFNVNGLAHKISFESEILFADASQDIDELPLYDALDDNAQEHFRRRFLFDTFGLIAGDDVPLQFDERFFAHRFGMQRYVSSPTTEIADDLAQVRLAMRNRWQTKRGLPGRQHIVDWVTLDIQGSFFPNADRDNFGSAAGMLDYDFRWHIGDRVSVLSDGFYDFFGQGLRTTSVGVMSSRPGVGDAYLGLRSIEGPISSNVLQGSFNYRLSDKWGLNSNAAFDLGDTGTIGSRIGVVYIGESFLWNLGINHDVSRGNTGFGFSFEPRLSRASRLLPLGGLGVGPPGARYLE